MKDHDPVNSPSHYTAGQIEVIDFIEDQNFSYHLGNAVKYICRAGKKDPAKFDEDLRKAIWYIERARMIRCLQSQPLGVADLIADDKARDRVAQ